METQLSIRIEQSNGSTCTPFFVNDEPIVFGEAPSHLIALAWQFDCSEFSPKWEGDHSKIPVHFGEDKLAMEHLQRVDIEEGLPQVHFQFGERVMAPQLGMIQQVHANISKTGRE